MTKLYAPESYWKYTAEQLRGIANGCGPDGWKWHVVPNHILWVSIKEACDIHDFMYFFGESEADREEADRVFLNNMLRIIEAKSGNFIALFVRRKIVLYYYSVVRDLGGSYFWHDKNPAETFKNPKEVFNNGFLEETLC